MRPSAFLLSPDSRRSQPALKSTWSHSRVRISLLTLQPVTYATSKTAFRSSGRLRRTARTARARRTQCACCAPPAWPRAGAPGDHPRDLAKPEHPLERGELAVDRGVNRLRLLP